MGDPVSWTMMAGAGVAAAGAMSQGAAQSSAARYNAQLSERNAATVSSQVAGQVARQRQEAELSFGSLLAGYGASGVSTDEGSPMDVLRMSIANAKLDEHNIVYRGELQKMGLAESATLDRMRAKTAETQAIYGAASSLLTGAGNAMYASRIASKGSGDSSTALEDAEALQSEARKKYGMK